MMKMNRSKTVTFRVRAEELHVLNELSKTLNCSASEVVRKLVQSAGVQCHLLSQADLEMLEPALKAGRPFPKGAVNV